VVVVNNGNHPATTARISAAARGAGATELRLTGASDGENTTEFIHEGLAAVCSATTSGSTCSGGCTRRTP
jgi:hypothetical protein